MKKKVLLQQCLGSKLRIPFGKIVHALFLPLRAPFGKLVSLSVASKQWIGILVKYKVYTKDIKEFERGSLQLKQRLNSAGFKGVTAIPTVGKCWETLNQREVLWLTKVYRQGCMVFNFAL